MYLGTREHQDEIAAGLKKERGIAEQQAIDLKNDSIAQKEREEEEEERKKREELAEEIAEVTQKTVEQAVQDTHNALQDRIHSLREPGASECDLQTADTLELLIENGSFDSAIAVGDNFTLQEFDSMMAGQSVSRDVRLQVAQEFVGIMDAEGGGALQVGDDLRSYVDNNGVISTPTSQLAVVEPNADLSTQPGTSPSMGMGR